MKTVFIGIARMGSTRLPGKVLKDLGGKPVLEHVVNVGRATPGVDEVWIATSTLPQDNVIEEWCDGADIHCFRGSETDVLSRFTGAALAAAWQHWTQGSIFSASSSRALLAQQSHR